MGMIDKFRQFLPGAGSPVPTVPPGSSVPSVGPRSEYMRGGRGVTFAGWRPAIRETHEEVAVSWQDAAARAFDVIHNSGWIAGAIEQAVADTVGTGLRLNALPDPEALGLSPREASKLAREIERRFNQWANDPLECDLEGRRKFGLIQAEAFKMWFSVGEILAEFPWRVRPGARYGTKVGIIPPYRLANKTSKYERLIQGVRRDADGMPISYMFRVRDEAGFIVDYERAARDNMGRPLILHAFVGMPGQVRGITPLVPALRVAKQFDQLADATLMASIIQTVFAATITADQPTQEMLDGLLSPQEQAKLASGGNSPFDAWFEAQSGWYDQTVLDVGINGRIAHLFPGQKLEFHGAKAPATAYKDFSLHLLRELARCLGLTYESATGDYQGVTFSSIRMATNSIFEIVRQRREFLIAPLCQAAYSAWLEEEVDSGRLPMPGGIDAFVANKSAITRAEWKGAPKPQPDDGKTATAHQTWKTLGVSSDGMIASDLGVDIEDVYAARAHEQELRAEYGITDPIADAPPPGDPGDPADPEAKGDQ